MSLCTPVPRISIHSINGLSDGFHLLATGNSACACVFHSFRYILRNGTTGSDDNSMFNILMNKPHILKQEIVYTGQNGRKRITEFLDVHVWGGGGTYAS